MTTAQLEAAEVADDHGGSFIATTFEHDDEVDGDVTQLLQPINPEPPRRSWRRRIMDALSRTLACVQESVGWLTSGVNNALRRRGYTGRHHIIKPVGHRVRITLLGRDRSTSEYSRAVQRSTREAAAKEGDLAEYFRPGDTFVDWLTSAHESLRQAQFSHNHQPAHGRWLCS